MHRRFLEALAAAVVASAPLACGDDGGATGSVDDGGTTDGGSTTVGSTSASSSTSVSTASSADGSESASTTAASTGATADSSGELGTDTDPPPSVELGEVCPLAERIGELRIWLAGGEASLYGVVWDRPDPWIGPAELANDSCAFHRFATQSCGQCDPDQVCSFEGECVAQRVAFTDAELDVTTEGVTETFAADGVTGELFGIVGDGTAELALTLRFGGQEIELPALGFGTAIADLAVTGEGDSCTPLAVDGTWTSPGDGSRVRTVIPINHHAGGPTFTVCDVPAEAGAFHADAEMLQPLAVITCLEFQGLDVAQTAALHTAIGCVDVRVGVQLPPDLQWQ